MVPEDSQLNLPVEYCLANLRCRCHARWPDGLMSDLIHLLSIGWSIGSVLGTESVEHWSRVWEIVGSNTWLSQTNDVSNWYLSLPSHVLGIIRIGHGLVGSVLGWCNWVGYQVMVLMAWFLSRAALQSCYECTVTSHYLPWYDLRCC